MRDHDDSPSLLTEAQIAGVSGGGSKPGGVGDGAVGPSRIRGGGGGGGLGGDHEPPGLTIHGGDAEGGDHEPPGVW
jgi:hypothetical protein